MPPNERLLHACSGSLAGDSQLSLRRVAEMLDISVSELQGRLDAGYAEEEAGSLSMTGLILETITPRVTSRVGMVGGTCGTHATHGRRVDSIGCRIRAGILPGAS